MDNSIQFKSQIFHYSTNIFLNPFLKSTSSLPIFIVSILLSPKTQIQKLIIYACNSLISVLSKMVTLRPQFQQRSRRETPLLEQERFDQVLFFDWGCYSARRSKRRNGSDKSTKFVLKLISTLASNLKILPQPLDLIVQKLLLQMK
ncbi:hypothetical protein EPI10_030627 [Gossypium australe]|uniref:Uncharacterized protein n=1 Tax=Gossypium australe TaxID=47621 RepID=A0A5B6WXR3_9ROSI|nr:hypothetical protein EPI10_030627 [Gossypium australe]